MKRLTLLLLTAIGTALGQIELPQYVLSSGISFDTSSAQVSSVNTLGLKIASIGGLPTYQTTTIETALKQTGTIRVGIAQVVMAKGNVALGVCTDAGVAKTVDNSTLGTISGCGFLSWDVGALVTKGKSHVYLIPTYRIISISGAQVLPSYALRIGTGL